MSGHMNLFADLTRCMSFDDIISTMRNYIKENDIPKDSVAVGFGYDHNFLKEKAHPDRFVLDKISSELSVMILHVSGHMGSANSKMLELAGITEKTADLYGGRFGRIEDTNEPSGYMEEAAFMQTQGIMYAHVKTDTTKMLSNMQNIYLQNGITTCQDGAATFENMKLLKEADEKGLLDVDVVVYPLVSDDPDRFMKENPEYIKNYHNHIKIGGLKMILDGSPQGKTAWMSEPYEGEGNYCAYPFFSRENAEKFVKYAVDNDFQILTHCNGDASSELLLDSYEKALKESSNPNKNNLRPVMIHCQTVRNDQLDRMAKTDMTASVFVGHVYFWVDIHVKNFGAKHGNHISPVKDALKRGLSVNFHQDTPITRPDMLHSIWCAVNRLSREGNVIGEDQKIDVYEGLKAATINCAFQYGEEDKKGSIREGKNADLIILDKNPLTTDKMEIKDIKVLETIKNGMTLYKR